jgi:ribosome-associated protein
MEEFTLDNTEFIELNSLLKVMGLCDSGGMAKAAISEGHVTVDSKVELRKRCKIRKGQIIEYKGHKIVIK